MACNHYDIQRKMDICHRAKACYIRIGYLVKMAENETWRSQSLLRVLIENRVRESTNYYFRSYKMPTNGPLMSMVRLAIYPNGVAFLRHRRAPVARGWLASDKPLPIARDCSLLSLKTRYARSLHFY